MFKFLLELRALFLESVSSLNDPMYTEGLWFEIWADPNRRGQLNITLIDRSFERFGY